MGEHTALRPTCMLLNGNEGRAERCATGSHPNQIAVIK